MRIHDTAAPARARAAQLRTYASRHHAVNRQERRHPGIVAQRQRAVLDDVRVARHVGLLPEPAKA